MKNVILILVSLCLSFSVFGQTSRNAYVDETGVLRWDTDSTEIFGFGVNYSVPFAHSYRMANRMAISPEEVIKQDVYHFARLDLDLYRVHVWDTEISDSTGNLLMNEHLRLFDFAINEMKKRAMQFIITPIAFWGNGWPEPDENTPGFSNKYGKEACLTNPHAIKAQARYLKQFLEHVNPYTGIAYKNDPDVIAFEVSNEPHHQGSKDEVVQYINVMSDAITNTGTSKPVFYNMSHSIHLADAYMEANIQGGTFQWYPSGLLANHALKGNFLPHVSDYIIPFSNHPGFKGKAKIVYEFDPADVFGNYMYPAMARSLREAGIQLATHFAYDAMFLAPYNTNYGTHYMNLAYTPQKAISLKIASAVFHEIPMKKDFGSFPDNNNFGNFKIDYTSDLVELVSEKRFFYSNHTTSLPPKINELEEIAGYANSPVVKYDGKGAYFLDKIEQGVWRLEVMPDAYWLDDPYAPVSTQRQVAAVNHTKRTMAIDLPQLGSGFSVEAINHGNAYTEKAKQGEITIEPGVYLLKNKNSQIDPNQPFKNITLNEYVAPSSNLDTILIKNFTGSKAIEGNSAYIDFEIIAPDRPTEVVIYIGSGRFARPLEVKKSVTDRYRVSMPDELTKHGTLNYSVSIKMDAHDWITFPSGIKARPGDWDFYSQQSYSIDFLPETSPLFLWRASTSWVKTMSTWNPGVKLLPSATEARLHYDLDKDTVSANPLIPLHTFKYYLGSEINTRRKVLHEKQHLVIKGQSFTDNNPTIEVSLIDKSGAVSSVQTKLKRCNDLIRIPLSQLHQGKYAIVPRPYPEFLPYYANIENASNFELSQTETIQVSVLRDEGSAKSLKFFLEAIWLE
jgi:hypothetical protein